jgi:hypothetical protein
MHASLDPGTVTRQEAGCCYRWRALLDTLAGFGFGSLRKTFFFEKKNQKTFTHLAAAFPDRLGQGAEVFCFFFSKKKSFLQRCRLSQSAAT